MALYLAGVVQSDLEGRFWNKGPLPSVIAFLVLLAWIAMTSMAAESLDDLIAENVTSPQDIRKLSTGYIFIGLCIFGLLTIAREKLKRKKPLKKR